MAFGLLFLSNWSSKRKVMLTLVIGVVFPLVLTIGEAARGLRRASDATVGERWNVLTGWEQIFSRGSFFDQTMSRLFSTGGHSLITMTPQDIPYIDFEFSRYLREYALTVFVPGRIYADPYYSSSYLLNPYGLRVNQYTSVELTIPGSLWILGGWLPVLLGGVWIGVLQVIVMRWISAATAKSPYQGLFYLTFIMAAFMNGITTELMWITTVIFRRALAAIVLWHLFARPILGRYAYSVRLPRRFSGYRPLPAYAQRRPALPHG
jgi:hypothetical protein